MIPAGMIERGERKNGVSRFFASMCGFALARTARSAKSAVFGGDRVFRNGAPRSMKMRTIASLWHYDAMRGAISAHAAPRG
jgi:hypothetical protein